MRSDLPSDLVRSPAWSGTALYGTFFLGACAYLFPFVSLHQRVGDEGALLHGAVRVLNGGIPSVDFVDVVGPGSFYWLAAFFALFGDTVEVSRALLLVVAAGSATLLLFLTRRVSSGPMQLLPAATFLLLGVPHWPATSQHWDSGFFVMLSIVLFLVWRSRLAGTWLVSSGVAAGVATTIMPHKGGVILAALLVALLVEEGPGLPVARWRRGAALVAGYAAVGLGALLFFLLQGAIDDLWRIHVTWTLENYEAVNLVPYGFTFTEFVWPGRSGLLIAAFGKAGMALAILSLVPLVTVMALPLLVVTLAALVLWKGGRAKILNRSLAVFWLTAFALWLSELHRPDVVHLVWGGPLMLVLVALLGEVAWTAGVRSVGWLSIGFGGSLLLAAAVHLSSALSAGHEIESRRGTLRGWTRDAALDYLLENTRRGQAVFVYPYYPMYYFLADLENPTRFNILLYQYNTPAQFREAIDSLESRRVELVLWDSIVGGENLMRWFPGYRPPVPERQALELYLTREYRRVGTASGFRLMRRRPIDEGRP